MSRAQTIVATLTPLLPDMTIRIGTPDERPSVDAGPVLLVHDGIASGIHLTLLADESDPLSALTKMVYLAARNTRYALGESELNLVFDVMKPVLDESDFRIGESLRFTAIEHSLA